MAQLVRTPPNLLQKVLTTQAEPDFIPRCPLDDFFNPGTYPWCIAKAHGIYDPKAIYLWSYTSGEIKFCFRTGLQDMFYLGSFLTRGVVKVLEPRALEEIVTLLYTGKEKELTTIIVPEVPMTWEQLEAELPKSDEETDEWDFLKTWWYYRENS